ncbi:MAG TPA: S1C family serine protease [Candidatus Acidoferrum sp.]|nr:S1C family serine protease [Candidatus Acidoferrum sp.]
MSAELIHLSEALSQATTAAAANIVAVHAEARGSSSGVIWRPGVIVTAEHALRHDEDIHLTLPDSRVIPATLAGRDPSTDLAVLKCAEASAAVTNFGDPSALKPGSLTLVVGRTRASGAVAALGVVSLVAGERRTWTGAALAPYIRLDVGLQPTAEGGAVVDAQGRIAGIATSRFARFGAIAIPAPAVARTVDTLLKKGHIPQGYLGVGLQTVRLPEALRQSLQRTERTAAIVLEVEPESPAHRAGIVIGDIFVALAGHPVARLEDVHSQLHGDTIGKTLALKFVRGGAAQEVNLVVGERSRGGE